MYVCGLMSVRADNNINSCHIEELQTLLFFEIHSPPVFIGSECGANADGILSDIYPAISGTKYPKLFPFYPRFPPFRPFRHYRTPVPHWAKPIRFSQISNMLDIAENRKEFLSGLPSFFAIPFRPFRSFPILYEIFPNPFRSR